MGLQIGEIVVRKPITFKELAGKIVAIDAFNAIYQFLTSIRQPDGTPLMDKNKEITSHLSGLFYRNVNLLADGILPVYVFDGKPPELKREEIEKRQEAKEEARERYEEAKEKEDVEGMKKYSSQFVKINDKIISESKELLLAMGIPVVQASGEGEAEAAYLARIGKAYASASQDYDSLLYGVPKLIRNLTLARKRKTISGYVEVAPEIIDIEYLLNQLQINRDQLICLGILVGTDYNPGGVRGIGQKRALDIVRKYVYPVKIFDFVKDNPKYSINFDWQEIYKVFHEYKSEDIELKFGRVDENKVREILLKHDFSADRIDNQLEKLREIRERKKQRTLF
ncbi:flap endonuclease-1 [Candidatus Pacearchaeota archaeon]|nr:flap endonuclease-1 [Candidatus Pacearchaeota archaeon]